MPQVGHSSRYAWRRKQALMLACAAFGAGLASSGVPSWFQRSTPKKLRGRPKEAKLLLSLGALLMPEEPAEDLIREFPHSDPQASRHRAFPPGLAVYGVLEDTDAALFVDYDGAPVHMQPAGKAADIAKTEELLRQSPPGSYVVRVAHEDRGLELDGNCLQVVVEPWELDHEYAFQKVLRQAVRSLMGNLHLRSGVQQMLVRWCEDGLHEPDEEVLAEVGLNHETWEKILGEHPNIVNFNLSVGNLKSSLAELQQTGLTPKQLGRIIAVRPQILGLNQSSDLESMVSELRELGLNQDQVASTIEKWPSGRNLAPAFSVKPYQEFLSAVGLSNEEIRKVLASHPRLLTLNIDEKMQPIVDFFREQGLDQASIVRIISRFPRIFDYNLSASLKPWAAGLSEAGLSPVQIAKVFVSYPTVFSYNCEVTLPPKIETFAELGMSDADVGKLIAGFPRILGISSQSIKSVVDWCQEVGLDDDETGRLIRAAPTVLGLREERLDETVRCVCKAGCNRTEAVRVIAQSPSVLTLAVKNLDLKIKLFRRYFSTKDLANFLSRKPKVLTHAYSRLVHRLSLLKQAEQLEQCSYLLGATDSQFNRWGSKQASKAFKK